MKQEVIKMDKRKKGIGYVCDVPIAEKVVITRAYQKIKIWLYAKSEGIDLVGIIEDNPTTGDLMSRPGVRKVMHSHSDIEVILVERVLCLSRRMKELEPFLNECDRRGQKVVAVSHCWDCVSQMVRRRYAEDLGEKARREAREMAGAKRAKKAA